MSPTTPHALIYTTALVCGLLLALSVHIGLTAMGYGIAGATPETFLSGKNQISLALAWWAIGIAGCLGSLAAIYLSRRMNSLPLQIVRMTIAAAFFCVLTVAGHQTAAPAGSGAAMNVITNLAAIALGGFMAFFAAYFAARR